MQKENQDSINEDRRKLLGLAGAAGAGALLSPLLSKAAPSTIIEAGSNVDTASYVIFQDSGTIYAKNGTTGKIDFQGSDASTVIQSAIDALTRGGKIFIRNGTYSISTTLTLASYIIMEGESTTYCTLQKTANINLITIPASARDITLQNLYLNSNGYSGDGVNATDSPTAWNIIIRNVRIYQGQYGFNLNPVWKVTFEHCWSTYATIDGYHIVNGTSIILNNCEFDQITTNGMYLASIEGFSITSGGGDHSGYAIKVINCTGSVIGTDCENNTNGFYFETLNGIVSGNKIYGTGAGWALYMTGACMATVTGNETNTSLWGSKIDNASGISLFNNTFDKALYMLASTNVIARNNIGFITENSGAAASTANGGAISHGLITTPTKVRCTPSVSGEMVSVTTLGLTTFTVAIIKNDGSAGTPQTIYWEAEA